MDERTRTARLGAQIELGKRVMANTHRVCVVLDENIFKAVQSLCRETGESAEQVCANILTGFIVTAQEENDANSHAEE